ncbi:unnamed protein product [Chilo suppressalis]|uniref:Triokinase/FMN cyclase n=1 Tax=Chilo suppressalis TaxID=168631 RepID=A0ABN8BCS7_CHISP|nr:unnamed protein product [Chilo suppressalis]
MKKVSATPYSFHPALKFGDIDRALPERVKECLSVNSKMASDRPVTNKFINSPESCVDDNLRGLVASNPLLHLHPQHRVVTVRPTEDTGKVAVIGGGGSGHEPFAAGFVGEGMLDGAVAGGIFASPPTGNVLYAITHLYKYNSGGVLVLIGNYTGDRLNFGKAIEKAKIAGIKVEGVIVGEDVASSHNKTGGRGMCAEVYLYKMCGALAAQGASLEEVRNLAVESSNYMATLGVCLSPCSLPGQAPLFEISRGMMELGVGVHGEAGISKVELGTAREVVSLVLGKIVEHLNLTSGHSVTAMVNNLGGTSILEMNIISKEIKEYLENKQITLERLYSGHMKSSLEMHGFQICLLHLAPEHAAGWLRLLDTDTSALAWPAPAPVRAGGGVGDYEDATVQTSDEKVATGPSLSSSEQSLLRDCLKTASEALIQNVELLNRLDSGCGDGDCGNTLKRFSLAILEYIRTASMEYPSNVLWDLSEIAERDMGGTSGGIYSLGLSAASQALASANCNDVASWLLAWDSATRAISKYGGAEPGDRTMLDSLQTAAVAFKENLSLDMKSLVRAAADAAERGAVTTAGMTASAGRASYVSSAYHGDEDAGARAVAIWLQAIFNCISKQL